MTQIDDSALPGEDTAQNDQSLLAEVRGRNEIIGRLVTERKGNEHADIFLPDTIYMTYLPSKIRDLCGSQQRGRNPLSISAGKFLQRRVLSRP